jgi:ubiquinone/menaquinone biosynthesis C-methylase UbiE
VAGGEAENFEAAGAFDLRKRNYRADGGSREVLECLYRTVDRGNIFLADQRLVWFIFGRNANAGIVDKWGDSLMPLSRREYEAYLKIAGMEGNTIRTILSPGTILLGDSADKPLKSYLLPHEYWHRVYMSLPDELKQEFDRAWARLPKGWRYQITECFWQGSYSEREHSNEFWALVLAEMSVQRANEVRVLSSDINKVIHSRAVRHIMAKYDLFELHSKTLASGVSIKKLESGRADGGGEDNSGEQIFNKRTLDHLLKISRLVDGRKLVYPGSMADISSAAYATNCDEYILIDREPFYRPDIMPAGFKVEAEWIQRYFNEKFRNGYAIYGDVPYIELPLREELERMGAQNIVAHGESEGFYRVDFFWRHPFDTQAKPRQVLFCQCDLRYPKTELLEEMRKGFDVYFVKAPLKLHIYGYKFIAQSLDSLSVKGFVVSDEDLFEVQKPALEILFSDITPKWEGEEVNFGYSAAGSRIWGKTKQSSQRDGGKRNTMIKGILTEHEGSRALRPLNEIEIKNFDRLVEYLKATWSLPDLRVYDSSHNTAFYNYINDLLFYSKEMYDPEKENLKLDTFQKNELSDTAVSIFGDFMLAGLLAQWFEMRQINKEPIKEDFLNDIFRNFQLTRYPIMRLEIPEDYVLAERKKDNDTSKDNQNKNFLLGEFEYPLNGSPMKSNIPLKKYRDFVLPDKEGWQWKIRSWNTLPRHWVKGLIPEFWRFSVIENDKETLLYSREQAGADEEVREASLSQDGTKLVIIKNIGLEVIDLETFKMIMTMRRNNVLTGAWLLSDDAEKNIRRFYKDGEVLTYSKRLAVLDGGKITLIKNIISKLSNEENRFAFRTDFLYKLASLDVFGASPKAVGQLLAFVKFDKEQQLRFLHIGSGQAGLLATVSREYSNIQGIGFDCSDTKMEFARSQAKARFDLIQGVDFAGLPFGDNSIDVILTETLEHTNRKRAEKAFAHYRRVLKDDGQLIINISDSTDRNVYYGFLTAARLMLLPPVYTWKEQELLEVAQRNGFSLIEKQRYVLADVLAYQFIFLKLKKAEYGFREFNIPAIENSLRSFEAMRLERGIFTEQKLKNLVRAYEYLNIILKENRDIHDSDILKLVFICTDAPQSWSWKGQSRYFENERARFNSLKRPVLDWYRQHKYLSPYRQAAGIYVRMVSHPQLFLEDGNQSTGILLMNFLLVKNGKAPWISAPENAKVFAGILGKIHSLNRNDTFVNVLMWSYERRFTQLLERYGDNKYLKDGGEVKQVIPFSAEKMVAVAEDDQDIRDLIEFWLQGKDFQVSVNCRM